MLDVMRKHSRSFVIYVFFAIIIAVFVINFGPQSAGCTTSGTSHAGTVGSKKLPLSDFEYAQSVWGIRQRQGTEQQLIRLRMIVMDKLVARELLADEALRLGFRIPMKEIRDMIFRGRFLALGQPRALIRGTDGKFDYDRFSRYVRYYWGLNVRRFQEQQRRELLADKMRQYLRTAVRVSPDEVRTDWEFRNTKVKLAYVRFSPADFAKDVKPDAKVLAAFIKKNEKRIAAKYKADKKTSYTKRPKELRLRVIEIKFKADDKASKTAAKVLATKLAAQLKGGADFAKLAAKHSQHSSKSNGGLLGWRTAKDAGIGKEASKAVAKVKKGKVTGAVAETDRFVIAKVEATREGDITLAQARDEIARALYVTDQTKALAKKKAAAFLARAKAGEKFADIFTADSPIDEGDAKKKGKKAADKKGADQKAADKKAADKKAKGKKAKGKKAKGKKAAAAAADKKADADKPKPPRSPITVNTTNLFSRNAQGLIPRLGISRSLTAEVFKLAKGQVVPHVVTIGKLMYLVKVIDKKSADLGAWTKQKNTLVEAFGNRKEAERVRNYTYNLCSKAAKAGKIKLDPMVFFTRGYVAGQRKAGKKVVMPSYTPCRNLRPTAYPPY